MIKSNIIKDYNNMKIEDNTFTVSSNSEEKVKDYFDSYNNIEITSRSKLRLTGRRSNSPSKNF